MTQGEVFELVRHDAVTELRLSRPEVHNRFDEVLLGSLAPVLMDLGADKRVRALVLSSTGKTFSAGGDFATMLAANGDLHVLLNQIDVGRRLFRAFGDFPKPLIAAVQGDTYGVATSLLLTADAIVTTATVKFSDPHVRIGLVAGDGGCVTWPLAMPMTRARRHLLWGEPITGEIAYGLGMVSDLVSEPEQVLPRALELAQEVASLPPIAVQLTKRALNKNLGSRADEVLDTSFYLEAISAQTADLREAVASFRERRPGVWSGA